MMFLFRYRLFLFVFLALFGLLLPSSAQNRINHRGQDLFLSGVNLAWKDFGDDVGPGSTDLNHFESVFDQIEGKGGNIMRLWVHAHGANTPAWNGSMVTGPGSGTVNDLKNILDEAWERKIGLMICLWSFDMLRVSNGDAITGRARDILTKSANRKSYIDHALIPMVQGLAGHPAIVAWEIFNEPEGMSKEHGWSNITGPVEDRVSMSDIQIFINQCAGAIHRTDPNVRVTNGAWSFISQSDVGSGNYNYYRDDRLIAAGGDADGVLDFYCVHYYDWAGTERSPFHHNASHWGLNKPLVVAEFYPDSSGCVNCGGTPYENLYNRGYAGALSWSWTDSSHSAILGHLEAMSLQHPGDVLIVENQLPSVTLVAPVDEQVFPSGTHVSLLAEASDPDGGISKVEFFAGTTKIGEDHSAPYEWVWTSPSLGQYELSAVAIDVDGAQVASEVRTILVGLPPTELKLQAESSSWTGSVSVISDVTADGGQGLRMEGSGSITWELTGIPMAGTYDLAIGYFLPYGRKEQSLVVNGGGPTTVDFEGPVNMWQEKVVQVPLQAGANTIVIEEDWGWMHFDYISLLIPNTGAEELPKPSFSWQGNDLTITFNSIPGRTYWVEYSTNLEDWDSVVGQDPVMGTGGNLSFELSNVILSTTGFFRVGVQP